MTSSEGWRGEPQSGHTGPETGCVEGLVFILTALGEGLQMLAFWGGQGATYMSGVRRQGDGVMKLGHDK